MRSLTLEARLECLRLVIESGVPPEKAIEQAAPLAAWVLSGEPAAASEVRADDSMDIEDLELTVRTTNTLRANDIHTVGQLTQRGPIDLLKLPNLGRGTLNEIMDTLIKHGRALRT